VETSDKTMCLQVSWNDTISVVKAMIQAKEYIERCDQVLKFNSIELEDNRSLWFYDITPGSTLRLGALPGGGKRAAAQAVDGGGREEKDSKIRTLRQDILATMVLTQNTRNVVTHSVRTRIMELERDFQQLPTDTLLQKLYKDMMEKQMLKLQERFHRCRSQLRRKVPRNQQVLFEQQFQQVEDCKRELDTMVKAINDTATLTMLTQFCNDAGVVNWEEFTKIMNKTATDKSREVGAAARDE
jgi:hypothetical protein